MFSSQPFTVFVKKNTPHDLPVPPAPDSTRRRTGPRAAAPDVALPQHPPPAGAALQLLAVVEAAQCRCMCTILVWHLPPCASLVLYVLVQSSWGLRSRTPRTRIDKSLCCTRN
jgi:hypothetical protein